MSNTKSNTQYTQSDNIYRPLREGALTILPNLPAKTFVVKFDERANQFFLSVVDDMTIPSKLYGDTQDVADRVLRTFNDRPATTGLLLVGNKGSGKTLLAKTVSVMSRELGMPTIIVNSPFAGVEFNDFMQSISQPCVVFVDEFEKLYEPRKQEGILTLLDGAYASKKLFILTCNAKHKLDENLPDRPGRMFYYLEYGGLSAEFIREYAQDNLKDKSEIDTLCKLADLLLDFNFDQLSSIVEEMNRYGETVKQAVKLLNIGKNGGVKQVYKIVYIKYQGTVVPPTRYHADEFDQNPLASSHNMSVSCWLPNNFLGGEADDNDNDLHISCSMNSNTLVAMADGQLTFKENDTEVALVKKTDGGKGIGEFL